MVRNLSRAHSRLHQMLSPAKRPFGLGRLRYLIPPESRVGVNYELADPWGPMYTVERKRDSQVPAVVPSHRRAESRMQYTERMLKPYGEVWVRHHPKNQGMSDPEAGSLRLRSRTDEIGRNSLTCLKIGRNSLTFSKSEEIALPCPGAETLEKVNTHNIASQMFSSMDN